MASMLMSVSDILKIRLEISTLLSISPLGSPLVRGLTSLSISPVMMSGERWCVSVDLWVRGGGDGDGGDATMSPCAGECRRQMTVVLCPLDVLELFRSVWGAQGGREDASWLRVPFAASG